MKNLGDFHDLYLLSDTLLLACVFEHFRNLALGIYQLDPVHYLSAPGLAWDAALKMTKVKLDLLTDIDKYEFLELGIRGGISMISTRKAVASNKYMKEYTGNGDEKDQSYLMYYDMNNLYGVAMMQPLPVCSFKWIKKSSFSKFDVSKVAENSFYGYILEVDLSYPSELHDLHNDYPLAPEKTSVPIDKFGNYQKRLLEKLELKYMEKQTKLIPHFGKRFNYVVHYRNLKYYLQMGMKLEKIHRILQFVQIPWLEPYISFNTSKRKQCKNKFEKDFYKLMNNAVYGKGMENVRKRMSIKLVNDVQKAKWLIAKPQFLTNDILSKNLCVIKMQTSTVFLNKAIYTGFSVLELSKLYMYKFHYFIKDKYEAQAILLMTDTDSLAYLFFTQDIYADMKLHLNMFDTSEYPLDHSLYSIKNKMVVGKMKDEAKGNILFKFVGLGPKAYCFLGGDKEGNSFEKKALKGIPQYIQKRSLEYSLFENILNQQEQLICKSNQIRSYKHQLYSISVSKSGVHGFDSKRFICEDGISTLAWGHYRLEQM